MALQRTLSIIKPDAVAANQVGAVAARLESAGLRIVAARMLHMTRAQAEAFYSVHRERPFFADLVGFMTSGPVQVQVLEGEDAVARNRKVMGATDPGSAEKGTIRADFGSNVQENAVHGSDSADTAAREIAFFFAAVDLCPRTR